MSTQSQYLFISGKKTKARSNMQREKSSYLTWIIPKHLGDIESLPSPRLHGQRELVHHTLMRHLSSMDPHHHLDNNTATQAVHLWLGKTAKFILIGCLYLGWDSRSLPKPHQLLGRLQKADSFVSSSPRWGPGCFAAQYPLPFFSCLTSS